MYNYSWKKIQASAPNRADDKQEWSVAYVPPGATRFKSSHKKQKDGDDDDDEMRTLTAVSGM